MFKLKIYRIQGDSMSPSIEDNSFLLIKSPIKKKKINKLFIFKHKLYGKLIKRLVKVDSSNLFWFMGENYHSLKKNQIGPINEDQILGQIVLSISRSSFKLHL